MFKGGNKTFIKNVKQLNVNNRYTIEFFDEGDGSIEDWIFEEFAPKYNGSYTLRNIKKLPATDEYIEEVYCIFENNKGNTLYLFESHDVEECGGYTCYFRCIVTRRGDPITIHEGDNAATYADYYNFAYCVISLDMDLLNVSRASRLNETKPLPLDVERNIQSFMVGNTKLDTK